VQMAIVALVCQAAKDVVRQNQRIVVMLPKVNVLHVYLTQMFVLPSSPSIATTYSGGSVNFKLRSCWGVQARILTSFFWYNIVRRGCKIKAGLISRKEWLSFWFGYGCYLVCFARSISFTAIFFPCISSRSCTTMRRSHRHQNLSCLVALILKALYRPLPLFLTFDTAK
jgi:hypothetical protein